MKAKTKTPVTLRAKKLKSGASSLYLDYYKSGVRRFEFLKLYLIPEKTPADKAQNKETLRLAEEIRARRYIEFESTNFGANISRQADGRKITLEKYCETYINREIEKGVLKPNTIETYKTFLVTIKAHEIGKSTLAGVTINLCCNYIKYLKNEFSENTAALNYKKLCRILNMAARFGYVPKNITKEIPRHEIPRHTPQKDILYLTAEEVRAFEEYKPRTHKKEVARRIFLFSCFTGLRLSDVQDLRHGEIKEINGKKYIMRHAIKTGKSINIPLNAKAAALIPQIINQTPQSNVFPPISIDYANQANKQIWKELQAAGKVSKDKKIHFHCARHTFATLLLSKNIDIYTISELLGHSDIKITQVYAKVMNKSKENALQVLDTI